MKSTFEKMFDIESHTKTQVSSLGSGLPHGGQHSTLYLNLPVLGHYNLWNKLTMTYYIFYNR